MYDGLVLSDLHLGAASSQVRHIQKFLENIPPTRRLVLNGDVLENTEHRLTKHHWKVLSQLRKLSDQLELVWVIGNHDFEADAIAHLIGATFVPRYEFSSGDKGVLCIHGHTWDNFITDHPMLTMAADWIYLSLQKMNRKLAVSAKRSSKTFLRCIEKVRVKALDYCRQHGWDIVVCGHTHHAEIARRNDHDCVSNPPIYFNTGCWTDHICHYWTIENGLTELHEVTAVEPADAPRDDATIHGVECGYPAHKTCPEMFGWQMSEQEVVATSE
jgi:UDP-2,3-diacylglucosamine pyrophosphatase LpxH